jgi:hypothetical protein
MRDALAVIVGAEWPAGQDDTVLAAVGDIAIDVPENLATDIAAIKEKTDTIGSLEITVVSPIDADGTIAVQQGQDLSADLGTQIDFDITSGVILNKSWTSAVATLHFDANDVVGVISDITGGKRLRFTATAAVTDLWEPGVYDYKAEVVFGDGEKYPIRGEITVTADILG